MIPFVSPMFNRGGGGLLRPAGTSLLMHFDGANGDTTFVDETGKTVTRSGNAQLSTISPKLGVACATFDGTVDFFSLPLSSDLQFGTGDFTIAFWIRTSVGTGYVVTGLGSGNTANNDYLFFLSGGNLNFAEGTTNRGTIGGIADGNWHHVAVSRAGGSLRFFCDGTQIGSTVTSTYNYLTGGSFGLYVGQRNNNSNGFNGQLDELIVVKGSALWTENFSPPTVAYS